MSVEQLKAEIEKLSLSERAELVRWLHRWEDDEWEQQIRADAAAGRLDELIDETDDAIKSGKLKDLP